MKIVLPVVIIIAITFLLVYLAPVLLLHNKKTGKSKTTLRIGNRMFTTETSWDDTEEKKKTPNGNTRNIKTNG